MACCTVLSSISLPSLSTWPEMFGRRTGRRRERASSVRPAPIRPAKPTISPRRTMKLACLTTTRDGSSRVADGPVPDLEERSPISGVCVGEAVVEVAADHAADDPVLVDAVGLDVEGLDGPAVADDRDRVGDLLDLVELVQIMIEVMPLRLQARASGPAGAGSRPR